MRSGVPCAGALSIGPPTAPTTAAALYYGRTPAQQCLPACPASGSSTHLPLLRLCTAPFDAYTLQCLATCPALVPPTSAHEPLRRQQRLRPAALDHAPRGDWRRVLRRCPQHQPTSRSNSGSIVLLLRRARPGARRRACSGALGISSPAAPAPAAVLCGCFPRARLAMPGGVSCAGALSISPPAAPTRRCFVLRIATRPPNNPWRRALLRVLSNTCRS